MQLDTLWSPLILSAKVSLISTLFVAIAGTYLGYLLSRRDFLGKGFIDALFTLPMVLPPTVTGYYLIILLGREGIIGGTLYRHTGWSITFTWQAAVMASFVVSLPIMVKTARAAIDAVNPEFEKVSMLLGKGKMETVIRITLPLAWRGLLAGAVLSFARGIGEFGATLMLAGNIPGRTATMPLAIYSATQAGDYRMANLLVLVLTVMSLGIILLTSRLTKKSL